MSEIKALRKAAGLTQQEAADRLDLNRHTFAAYERGDRTPDYPTGKRIREELGGETEGLPDGVVPIEVQSAAAGRGKGIDQTEKLYFDRGLLTGTPFEVEDVDFMRVLGSGLEPALSHRQLAITEPVDRIVGDDIYCYHCSASGGVVMGIMSAVPAGIELETRGLNPKTELLRHVEGDTYADADGNQSDITLIGRIVLGVGNPADTLSRMNEAARVTA